MARAESKTNYLWACRDLFNHFKARGEWAALVDTCPSPAGDLYTGQQIQDQLMAPAVCGCQTTPQFVQVPVWRSALSSEPSDTSVAWDNTSVCWFWSLTASICCFINKMKFLQWLKFLLLTKSKMIVLQKHTTYSLVFLRMGQCNKVTWWHLMQIKAPKNVVTQNNLNFQGCFKWRQKKMNLSLTFCRCVTTWMTNILDLPHSHSLCWCIM